MPLRLRESAARALEASFGQLQYRMISRSRGILVARFELIQRHMNGPGNRAASSLASSRASCKSTIRTTAILHFAMQLIGSNAGNPPAGSACAERISTPPSLPPRDHQTMIPTPVLIASRPRAKLRPEHEAEPGESARPGQCPAPVVDQKSPHRHESGPPGRRDSAQAGINLANNSASGP